jgi:hypothetical protein
MKAVDSATVGDDAIEHCVRLAKLAFVFVEKASRGEAARDQLQVVGVVKQIQAHRDHADDGIRLTEERVPQSRERTAAGDAKGGMA